MGTCHCIFVGPSWPVRLGLVTGGRFVSNGIDLLRWREDWGFWAAIQSHLLLLSTSATQRKIWPPLSASEVEAMWNSSHPVIFLSFHFLSVLQTGFHISIVRRFCWFFSLSLRSCPAQPAVFLRASFFFASAPSNVKVVVLDLHLVP